MVLSDAHINFLRLKMQNNYEKCVNQKCLNFKENADGKAQIVQECVEACEQPLKKQQEYAVKQFGKFNSRLYATMEQTCLEGKSAAQLENQVDVENCFDRVKIEQEKLVQSYYRTDLIAYMNFLIKEQ